MFIQSCPWMHLALAFICFEFWNVGRRLEAGGLTKYKAFMFLAYIDRMLDVQFYFCIRILSYTFMGTAQVSPEDFDPNFYAAMDEVQLLRVDVDKRFMPGSCRRQPPSEICTKSSQCHRKIIVTTSMLQRCFANDHFILSRFAWHAYVPVHFSAGVWVVLWFTLCQSTDYIL